MTCKHNRIIKKMCIKNGKYIDIYACAFCGCKMKVEAIGVDSTMVRSDKHF